MRPWPGHSRGEKGPPTWLPLSLSRRSRARRTYPVVNVRSGFAQSRRFEKRFPLDSGRCSLCAAAGLVRQLGKAIAQRDVSSDQVSQGVAPRIGGSARSSQSPMEAVMRR